MFPCIFFYFGKDLIIFMRMVLKRSGFEQKCLYRAVRNNNLFDPCN